MVSSANGQQCKVTRETERGRERNQLREGRCAQKSPSRLRPVLHARSSHRQSAPTPSMHCSINCLDFNSGAEPQCEVLMSRSCVGKRHAHSSSVMCFCCTFASPRQAEPHDAKALLLLLLSSPQDECGAVNLVPRLHLHQRLPQLCSGRFWQPTATTCFAALQDLQAKISFEFASHAITCGT